MSGVDNQDADVLSRLPGIDGTKGNNNRDQKIQDIVNSGSIELPFVLKDGLLCHVKNCNTVLVILRRMVEKFMYAVHNHPTSGHMGRDKT
ncbi:hypothetical protein BD770DRAFT_443431 [Pilaira anomala]|nr:hypothetical protein BD770DRAFT_443431 [Pilaira anomala]